MRAIMRPHRQQKRSAWSLVSLVLAVVCIVQLHLLRPRHNSPSSPEGEDPASADSMFAQERSAGGAADSSQAGTHNGLPARVAPSRGAVAADARAAAGGALARGSGSAAAGANSGLAALGLARSGGGTANRVAPRLDYEAGALHARAILARVTALTGQGDSSGRTMTAQAAATDGSADAAASLDAVRGAKLAFITFGNGAFAEFVSNWVLGVRRLGVPFLVGALDAPMTAVCAARGWPHLDMSALLQGNTSFFRANFKAFRSMGATKVQLVLTMLEDLKVETVVVSDSDVSWLGDPSAYLATRPTADLYISTDCLSHQLEAEWKVKHNQPRCGHIPGNSWGRAFNTGVFAVRNRKAGRLLLARWRDLLLNPEHSTVVTRTNATLGITDQLALNMILDAAIPAGPVHSAPEDSHVLLLKWGEDDTLRLHPLPVALFPSGHVAFVQRTPWRHNFDPLAVHATFQRYQVSFHQVGKRARFRELGMWFLDGPEYYAPPAARYLTYANDVRAVIDDVAAARFGGAMPLFYRHMVGVSYQLAQYRDALAVARITNRTLVLPATWCWCDYDWVPHVLEKCKIRGSDLQLPFECPADFIFHIPFMEQHGVDYRMPGFLENPNVPEFVRHGLAKVQALPAKPATAAPAPGQLWPRMQQAEVAAALQPLDRSPVLSISGLRPGLLEGFADRRDGAAFDKLFAAVTNELYWCCSAQGHASWNAFAYDKPKPLAAGYQPWQPPVMQVPAYCDRVNAANKEYVAYPNHPCQFLRNQTAAAEAAALA